MSEYQYYEFRAVDRRLDEKEMQELRRYSSRAKITPNSFINEYSYGDFKGDENLWMEKYFDAYLYVANWGTHELQLRVPDKLLSLESARAYCPGDGASVRKKAGSLIFTFTSDEEGGDGWIEGDGILASILPVRAELMRGDLRALYIGWLSYVQHEELDEDSVEPPVPPNLGRMTASLSNLADFLCIGSDLLAVAAKTSAIQKVKPVDRATLAAWVASLPAAEKDGLLVQLMEGNDAEIGAELHARFSRQTPAVAVAKQLPRTAGQLLAAAEARTGGRQKKEGM